MSQITLYGTWVGEARYVKLKSHHDVVATRGLPAVAWCCGARRLHADDRTPLPEDCHVFTLCVCVMVLLHCFAIPSIHTFTHHFSPQYILGTLYSFTPTHWGTRAGVTSGVGVVNAPGCGKTKAAVLDLLRVRSELH